jgi:hypothetical protein
VEDCIRDGNIDHLKRVVIDNKDNNKDGDREWGVRGDHSGEDSGLSKTVLTSYISPRRRKRKWMADELAASELSLVLKRIAQIQRDLTKLIQSRKSEDKRNI